MKKVLLLILPLLLTACTKEPVKSSSESRNSVSSSESAPLASSSSEQIVSSVSSEQVDSSSESDQTTSILSSEQSTVDSSFDSDESSSLESSSIMTSEETIESSSVEETSITSSESISESSSSESIHEHDYELVVSKYSYWHTFIAGEDFDPTGLQISLRCKTCGEKEVVEYSLENDKELAIDQKSVLVTYDDYSLNYPIEVKEKYRIACVGDSLTAGHYWANESYPSYLSTMVDEKYQVENFGVNGISITGYGGSWNDPEMRYIKQDVYQRSVDYEPDIIAMMLGTNDATGWANAEESFLDEYYTLIDSYLELFPNVQIIMMVSPPTKDGNQFGIPNDTINEQVNPVQRDLAYEYGFEILDLREEFEENENYESEYLRPNNDGVHFTVAAAQYVASRVWDIAKDLRF